MSTEYLNLHVSRSWKGMGHPLENECPCFQEPCGYVSLDNVDPECTQHGILGAKTIRDSHYEKDCPGTE